MATKKAGDMSKRERALAREEKRQAGDSKTLKAKRSTKKVK